MKAAKDLAAALFALGFNEVTPAAGPTLSVRAGGTDLSVTVEFASAPSSSTVGQLVASEPAPARPDRLHVLVSDRLSSAARARLREGGWGWLDRRGHLRLWAPDHGIRIETEIEPLRARRAPDYQDPFATGVGLDVAIALLIEPDRPTSVRALSRSLARSASAVSVSLRRLREASLVTERTEPLIPELFEELSRYWAPRRIPLARAPLPDDVRSLRRMEFNFHDPTLPGWALTDTLAAHHYGAPVVVADTYPPDFYVPSDAVLRDATSYFGLAPSFEARACTVAVPPARAAVTTRVVPAGGAGAELLLAHPLFVALELARDRARGREILDQWTPPPEFARVW